MFANKEPSITFEKITFSDGTEISLEPDDIVLLVGPNNAGKSAAFRELARHVGLQIDGKIITKSKFRRIGNVKDVTRFIKENSIQDPNNHRSKYEGYKFSIDPDYLSGGQSHDRGIDSFWKKKPSASSYVASEISPLFCQIIETQNRINGADSAPPIDILDSPPSHPIHMLMKDEVLEQKMGGYIKKAFGEEIIVDRSGGKEYSLLIGNRPSVNIKEREDRVSITYLKKLRNSTELMETQGDGIRSFSNVVLHLIAPVTPSILMLDEPEAFLHPPQARLLGEIIATERAPRTQLFVATHSPDVLNGLLKVAPENLRVLRIQREGNINHVKELDKHRARDISTDPLMRYSSVLSGVFHKRVIICESESDCMFYSALLDLPSVHGVQKPDVLFVHANGKARIAELAKALKQLDVTVDVIADIDILQVEQDLLNVVEALTGHIRADIRNNARIVRDSIESRKNTQKANEIYKSIKDIFDGLDLSKNFPESARSQIQRLIKNTSQWQRIKEDGEASIPKGEASMTFSKLKELCKEARLWIVHVGELEGFYKSIGNKGPKWVQKVLSELDLANSPGLADARNFVQEIWNSNNEPE